MVKNGKVIIGYFNDEFFEDNSILVDCKVIKIKDIDKIIVTDKFIEFENAQPDIIKKKNDSDSAKKVC